MPAKTAVSWASCALLDTKDTMTKKQSAIMRADDAFRRFMPMSQESSARDFYTFARRDFDSLLETLNAGETMLLKTMLDSLRDCTRLDR